MNFINFKILFFPTNIAYILKHEHINFLIKKYSPAMSFGNCFDLNFSPRLEEQLENADETSIHVVEEGLKNGTLLDLNIGYFLYTLLKLFVIPSF